MNFRTKSFSDLLDEKKRIEEESLSHYDKPAHWLLRIEKLWNRVKKIMREDTDYISEYLKLSGGYCSQAFKATNSGRSPVKMTAEEFSHFLNVREEAITTFAVIRLLVESVKKSIASKKSRGKFRRIMKTMNKEGIFRSFKKLVMEMAGVAQSDAIILRDHLPC